MVDATSGKPSWLAQAAHRLEALSATAGEFFHDGLQRPRHTHDGLPSHIDLSGDTAREQFAQSHSSRVQSQLKSFAPTAWHCGG